MLSGAELRDDSCCVLPLPLSRHGHLPLLRQLLYRGDPLISARASEGVTPAAVTEIL